MPTKCWPAPKHSNSRNNVQASPQKRAARLAVEVSPLTLRQPESTRLPSPKPLPPHHPMATPRTRPVGGSVSAKALRQNSVARSVALRGCRKRLFHTQSSRASSRAAARHPSRGRSTSRRERGEGRPGREVFARSPRGGCPTQFRVGLQGVTAGRIDPRSSLLGQPRKPVSGGFPAGSHESAFVPVAATF